MIVKILPPKTSGFVGIVTYNTNKVDKNKGELMRVANFGALQAFSNLRPQDYINYFQMVTNRNKNIRKPQFHVVISAKQKLYDKSALTSIAENWMKEMGYGTQPYLIVFHRDTVHNHVHIVSTRIDKEGKKISSAWEHVQAQKSINKVLGYDFAFQYQFSTRAQFMMLLENQGFLGRDPDEQKIRSQIDLHVPDRARANAIKQVLELHKGHPDFESYLHTKFGISLVFHSAEGQMPYGYSIIDHAGKQVFKGSEVMRLKDLLPHHTDHSPVTFGPTTPDFTSGPVYIPPVFIAADINDEGILGRNRRRKRKARTNSR
jgi:hypothetical protein